MTDAGELLLAMQAKQPKAFQRFLHTHRPMHKDPDGSDWEEHAKQPVWRCVEHLVKLFVRTVEYNTSAKRDGSLADGVVQEEEATAFLRNRTAGINLENVEGSLAGRDVDFFKIMDNAASKIVVTAAAIKIQMASRLRKARMRIQIRKAELAAQQAAASSAAAPPPPAAGDASARA